MIVTGSLLPGPKVSPERLAEATPRYSMTMSSDYHHDSTPTRR